MAGIRNKSIFRTALASTTGSMACCTSPTIATASSLSDDLWFDMSLSMVGRRSELASMGVYYLARPLGMQRKEESTKRQQLLKKGRERKN